LGEKHVLITGGAGFIGSHLADELLAGGYRVRAFDSLLPQVHGDRTSWPDYMDAEVEPIVGDVRDPDAVRYALEGVDVVFHLAAAVGVGQSMYEVEHYTSVNNLGTAVLLEALTRKPVERLIVASSMSLYGEGLYRAPDGEVATGVARNTEQLKAGDWEVRNSRGDILTPLPTPEWKQPSLASVYALSKYDQERLCLLIGRAYNIPTVALRFFNVYGTRQSLLNPYTGVLAIFASCLLNERPPLIFEDGLQRRDFVSVKDVVQACRLALKVESAAGGVFNVGSGKAYAICEIAHAIAAALGKRHLCPEITGQYRNGDIRHCFADITAARQLLGYAPLVSLEEGMTELVGWLGGQAAPNHETKARDELTAKGLII
jgi:dTDP-L-rhamnose 4-epimerase